MRGLFLRGVDGSAGRDPDKASRTATPDGNTIIGPLLGSYQKDAFKSHQHATPFFNGDSVWGREPNSGESIAGAGQNSSYPKSLTKENGGSETRPKNAYVNYIIKY